MPKGQGSGCRREDRWHGRLVAACGRGAGRSAGSCCGDVGSGVCERSGVPVLRTGLAQLLGHKHRRAERCVHSVREDVRVAVMALCLGPGSTMAGKWHVQFSFLGHKGQGHRYG